MMQLSVTVDKLYYFKNKFTLTKNGVTERSAFVIRPVKHRKTGIEYWQLDSSESYLGICIIKETIPESFTPNIEIYDILTENGIIVKVGSIKNGKIHFLLYNTVTEKTILEKGVTIGTVKFLTV